MATTRTKEEQQLLDEKIARIQKKNEEILRRQKEIEEDKRLAEQQNALVKLRPSTVNTSRERTPALKPSKRELREDFTDNVEFQEPVIQRSSRGSFRGRGGERYRGQGDWKGTGPPPDPKSFLYDDERDGPSRDRDGKNDMKREFDRNLSSSGGPERDTREENRGGREFQRGVRRGGGERRPERGRRGGGRGGRGGRNEEEAWRAERMRIDEARIQRQKSADGKWRREWDNEKIMQDDIEDPRFESANKEQWHPLHDHHQHHEHHQHHHHHHHHSDHHHSDHHQCQMHVHGPHQHSPHDSATLPHHPHSHPVSSRRGRGRGRLDPTELDMPLDSIPILLQQKVSPTLQKGSLIVENTPRHQKSLPSDSSPTDQDGFKFSQDRSIECVGSTVKISIPNTNVGQPPPKAQRRVTEPRGRLRSQTSYSSQSDEESPRDRAQRGGRRQRTQKYPKDQDKTTNINKGAENNAAIKVTVQNKPPIPPVKSSQMPLTSGEDKEGDDSWETTSGAESMGEELSSVHSSPGKSIPNMIIVNSSAHNESAAGDVLTVDITPSDYNFDEYLNQISVSAVPTSLTKGELDESSIINSQVVGIEPLTVDRDIHHDSTDQNVNPIDIKSMVDMKEIETILKEFSVNASKIPDEKENVSKRVENTLNEEVFKGELNSEKESGNCIDENVINSVEKPTSEKVVELDCTTKLKTENVFESDSIKLNHEKEALNGIIEGNTINSDKTTPSEHVLELECSKQLQPENIFESDCSIKLNQEKEVLEGSTQEITINSVKNTTSEEVVDLECSKKLETEENTTVKTNLLKLESENVKSEDIIGKEDISIDLVQNKNEEVIKDSDSQTPSEGSTKVSETQQLGTVSESTCTDKKLTSSNTD